MKSDFVLFCTSVLSFAAAMSVLACGSALSATCNKPNDKLAVSATTLSFGVYSPGSGSPTDSNGTVKVYCANLTSILPSFTVTLSAGAAGKFNPRQMLNGSNVLSYNMFIDPGYATIWGDGTSGTSVQSYSANQNRSTISYTDYGQVFSSQFVTAGAYSDAIVVTVTF